MVRTSRDKWIARVLTSLVWAVVAASAAYWALRWGESQSPSTAVAVAQNQSASGTVDSAAVARLLGAGTAVAAPVLGAVNRYVLTGVVARTRTGQGAALIAIDGKPAKAFGVGAPLHDGLYLVAVSPRQARLSQLPNGPTSITLELPAPRP